MTIKDYKLIGEVIANLTMADWIRQKTAEAFIKRLQQENSRFKPHLFLRACNLPEGE